MAGIAELLHGGPVDETEVRRVRGVLLFEEPRLKEQLIRFGALLILSAAIATYGLIADSVATVIGAMIVAPLMLPIMGLAFGISIGDKKAILSSLVVALCGIGTAIGVGYLLSLPFAFTLDVENNQQIISRTAPRLVDLAAALATGLAGAFATGREDISDTLPGVAIAISLVPPLANVGILLGQHRPDLAMGSLLLFATNYLAILLTGSFMFGVMGFPKAVLEGRSKRARATAIALVVLFACMIIVPLAATSFSVAVEHTVTARTTQAVDAWLEGTAYRVASIGVSGEGVRVVVAGSGERPSTAELEAELAGRLFGRDVVLETLPEKVEKFSTR